MKTFLQVSLLVVSALVLLLSLLTLYRLKAPASPMLWGLKIFASAPASLYLIASLLFLGVGIAMNYVPVKVFALSSTAIFLFHILCITRPPKVSDGFSQAFGDNWKNDIPKEHKTRFLPARYVGYLPSPPEPIFIKDITYFTFPVTSRQLLCDIWQPSPDVTPSKLAFIYVHGSKWYYLDKDVGTRTFFRHLASQGHVIMDISYRLYPETDFTGMVYDVKHAIAWMKKNATQYGVDSNRIVLGGGSAGGHLALFAAYTADDQQLTPDDLLHVDTRVRGVVSMYGPTDLKDHYYHSGLHLLSKVKKDQDEGNPPPAFPPWLQKKMGKDFYRFGFDKDPAKGTVETFFNGTPEEKPALYAAYSPVNYVHAQCPPTLLIQGSHDFVTPVSSFKKFSARLKEAKVPVVTHLIPTVDHAFDLILPKVNPAAHNCYYDVERFLALVNR